jgi:hypothetical protein
MSDDKDWDTLEGGTLTFDVMTSWGLTGPRGGQIYLRVSYATSQEHLDAVRAKKQKPKNLQVVISLSVARDIALGLVKIANVADAQTRAKARPH